MSEEDDENTKNIQPTLLPDKIYTDLLSEEMLAYSFRKRKEQLKHYNERENGLGALNEEEALNFYQEDVKLWVDPLDGTKSFSSGKTEYCTTLIGVSIAGRPRIGVIHKPYFSSKDAEEELSKTYLGSIECGLFTSEYNYAHTDDNDSRHIHRNFSYCDPFNQDPIFNPKTFEPHIAATLNRFSAVEKALELLKPNVTMRIGGSGNKCLYILDNKADYLIHTVKSMKYWDVCAVEALIRGRFGVVTDKDKKPIIYEP